MSIPIHFIELEDMIPELSSARTIRMSAVAQNIKAYDDDPRAVRIQVILYVRQLGSDNTILSWSMPIGEPIDMYRGAGMDGQAQEQVDAVWVQASEVQDLIHERLLQHNEDFDIRGGVVSIGVNDDITGYWSYLEMQDDQQPNDVVAQVPDDEDEIPF
jgi:hypothetical protein